MKNFLIAAYDSNGNNDIDLGDKNLPSWMKSLFNANGTFNYELAHTILQTNNIKSLDTSIFSNITTTAESRQLDINFVINALGQRWTASDGKIGRFRQGYATGDCYFLAGLQAIANTTNGRKIIKKSITKKNDVYTVKFKGALKVKNNIEQQIKNKKIRGKCFITGNYTITQDEIKIAQEKNKKYGNYSDGDLDVLVFELAIEKYRKELKRTKDSSPDMKNLNMQTAESSVDGHSYDNIIEGGWGYDAMFLITGEKSLYWHSEKSKNQIKTYVKGSYQQIPRQDFLSGNYSIDQDKKFTPTKETYGVTTGDKACHQRLTALEGHRDDYAITVSVMYQSSPTKKGSHAITVEKITPEYVFISNPHDSSIIEIVPRKEFEQMIFSISACPPQKPDPNNEAYIKILQYFQQLNSVNTVDSDK